ncbi:nucleobase:cation symporter-2 family protein [Lactonifactor longoviformis]|uniref:Nucleobase:cation symporter-2, NCS2 family n=2 Tax=Lactonifactor TaxID=420345 RepID=A0A1M4ZWY0_9CLOT|nr:nucleobase:cation symporter-2 family protein [Lactonifactor longoviformis]SHF22533.1 nucleobase:cation symporter-2, NCS2 family [Lactonifactor longoviformis DSM 17459]
MDEINQKLPISKLSVLGLQHVLILYFSSVSVPLIVGNALKLSTGEIAFLINASLLCAGIATLVQSIGFGKYVGLKMPVMQGMTLMASGALTAIATSYDIQTVFGAVIAAGVVCLVIGPVFSKLMPLFPNIVRGCVISVVGLTLIPVAVNWIAGTKDTELYGHPTNFLLALIVVAVIVVLNKFCTGFVKNIAVLIALCAGFAAALAMGRVDLSGVSQASWFGVTLPFHFGLPKFALTPIVSLSVVMLVIMAESIVIYLAIGEIVEHDTTEKDMSRGFIANGINVIFSGIFNSFVFTSFTQNIGLVALTKIKSRFTTAAGGVILILLGFFPKIATIVASIPSPVLGGVGIVVFATITASGIKTMMSADISKGDNSLIAALSIGVGLGSTLLKSAGAFAAFSPNIRIFLEDGVITGCITAVVLNLIFNGYREKEKK